MTARMILTDGSQLHGVELTDTEIRSTFGARVVLNSCLLTRCDLSGLFSVEIIGCTLVRCVMPWEAKEADTATQDCRPPGGPDYRVSFGRTPRIVEDAQPLWFNEDGSAFRPMT